MAKFCITVFLSIASTFLFAQKESYNLVIGTYTNSGKSEGLYIYDFNLLTASTVLRTTTKNIVNPNFLSLSPDQKYVYVVNETNNTGSISAFKFHAEKKELTLINTVSSQGSGPCHVTVDNKNVLVANYRSGSLSVFNRLDNGGLTNAVQVIKHFGNSVDLKAQPTAHVHMNQFTPDHKYIVSTDLGENLLYIYHYNPAGKNTTLVLNNVVKINPGSGPRHLTFSPNGKFAYLVSEFNGKITAFSYKDGVLCKNHEISTMPDGYTGKFDGADIHVSADGKFLYQTNRGDANSISTFSISRSGKLQLIEVRPTLGKGPRNFTIDPSGNYVLVAHQYSNDVVIFNRNSKTGKLSDSGKRIDVGSPVCLVFIK